MYNMSKMSVREKNKARKIGGGQLGQDCYFTLDEKRKFNC